MLLLLLLFPVVSGARNDERLCGKKIMNGKKKPKEGEVRKGRREGVWEGCEGREERERGREK